jgi:membrane-bound serine protease (ClpP class)
MTSIIVLILAALALMFLEIFIPGGLATIIAAALILWASALAVEPYGWDVALSILLGGGCLAVLTILIEIRMISNSPLAKYFLHQDAHETSALPEVTDDLEGQSGVALTTISPTGKVLLNGRSHTARSRDGLLAKGTPVKVVGRDSFQLIVKKL